MPWNLEASAGIPGTSVLWRGVWSAALSYNPKDAVTGSDGSSYISKTNNTNKDPTISPLDWDLAAKVGDRGTNAWTLTTSNFTTPPVGGNTTVSVAEAEWVTIGQMIVIETAGGGELEAYSYRVRDKVGDILTIENIGTTAKAVPYEALGDMTKAVYDTDNDGLVDHAEVADTAPWAGITGTPSTFPPSAHAPTHNFGGLDSIAPDWVQIVNKPALYSSFVTLTDGATITWTVSTTQVTQNAMVTLGGARTLVFSGIAAGMNGTLICKQDGVGNRTLALPSDSKVINAGAGSITLSTAGNAVDLLTWIYDGVNYFWTFGKTYT